MRRWMTRVPWTAAGRRARDAEICMATKQRLQEIVDGELPNNAANDELLRHLDACVRCGEEAGAIRELKQSIRRVLDRSASGLADRIADVARQAAANDPDDDSSGDVTGPGR